MQIVRIAHLLIPLLQKIIDNYAIVEDTLEKLDKNNPVLDDESFFIDVDFSVKKKGVGQQKIALQTCLGEQAELFVPRYKMNMSHVWDRMGLDKDVEMWTSYKVDGFTGALLDWDKKPLLKQTYLHDKIAIDGNGTIKSPSSCVSIRDTGHDNYLLKEKACTDHLLTICMHDTDPKLNPEHLEVSRERINWQLTMIKTDRERARYFISLYNNLKSFPKIEDKNPSYKINMTESFEKVLETINFKVDQWSKIAEYDYEKAKSWINILRAGTEFSESFIENALLSPMGLNKTNTTRPTHYFYAYPASDKVLMVKTYETFDTSMDWFGNFFLLSLADCIIALTAIATLTFTIVRGFTTRSVYLSVKEKDCSHKKKRTRKTKRKEVKLVSLKPPPHSKIDFDSTSSDEAKKHKEKISQYSSSSSTDPSDFQSCRC